MTHQAILNEIRTAHERAVEEDTRPGASVGASGGVAGISVRDNAGRIAMCVLDVAAIDGLIDELLEARSHLAHWVSR
jgi:hypothetical protein